MNRKETTEFLSELLVADMITDGEEAGMFTTSEDKATKIAVNGVFLGETDDGIANAEFIPISVMAATTEGGTE